MNAMAQSLATELYDGKFNKNFVCFLRPFQLLCCSVRVPVSVCMCFSLSSDFMKTLIAIYFIRRLIPNFMGAEERCVHEVVKKKEHVE